MPLSEFSQNLDDADAPRAPLRHPERLAGSIEATRRRARWHHPRDVRQAAALVLLMVGGALLVANVATGVLLDETVLAALGIGP